MKQHVQRMHLKRRFSCNCCQKSWTSNRSLRNHVRIAHLGEMYECKPCTKVFRLKENLNRHKKIQHGSEPPPYQCEVCGKGFWKRVTFEGHKNEHFGLKPFLCAKCGRGFPLEAYRKRHALVCGLHDRSEKCDLCGMTFTLKRYLCNHVRVVHQDCQRQHLCSSCGKDFKYKKSLVDHVKRYHMTEPFECLICDAKRIGFIKYQKHLKVHQNKPARVQCDVCGKSYSREPDLKEHKKTVHEGQPFSCTLCDKVFFAKKRLLHHLRKKHQGAQ